MGAGAGSPGVVVILDGDVEVGRGCLDGVAAGLPLVEVLARIQLAARRLGYSVVVRDPSPALRELLDLVGLAGVVETSPSGSVLQPGGQAEELEQLRVQEVLPGRDAPA